MPNTKSCGHCGQLYAGQRATLASYACNTPTCPFNTAAYAPATITSFAIPTSRATRARSADACELKWPPTVNTETRTSVLSVRCAYSFADFTCFLSAAPRGPQLSYSFA